MNLEIVPGSKDLGFCGGNANQVQGGIKCLHRGFSTPHSTSTKWKNVDSDSDPDRQCSTFECAVCVNDI